MSEFFISMINEIGRQCLSSGYTLSTAESVTSGYLQFLFSQGDDCTSYYQGGITVYNNMQKCRQLGISLSVTNGNHGVSRLVAEQLALAANDHFKTDIGLGITGFAYRDGHLNITVPHAFVAIAVKGKAVCCRKVTSNFR